MSLMMMPQPALPSADAAAAVVELRGFLRMTGDGEAELLAGLTDSAAVLCEAFTGTMLIARDVSEPLTATGDWQPLGAAPVIAIGAIERGGVALPVDGYAVDIDASGIGWVRVALPAGPLVARYRAGQAADWAAIAPPLRQGIVRLAAHLFTERDDAAPPAAVTALWRPWRRVRLT